MTTDTREILYYKEIKEGRGDYFVEYHPPVSKTPFATLSIIYPKGHTTERIKRDFQIEAMHWLGRYNVPIMASAWDAKEDLIYANGTYEEAHFYAWYQPGTKNVVSTCKKEELPALFNDTENRPDWRTIYTDQTARTDAQVKADALKSLGQTRKGILIWKAVLTLWLAVIPASWAIIQYLGPEWLAAAVLLYSLWQAVHAWRKIMGYAKPSRSDKEKSEKELRMQHYFYHCERNPEGFARLKIENFNRDASERVRQEADALTKTEK